MKIRVTSKPKVQKITIHVRERETYVCKDCKNKYYSFHYFCPQCLGEIAVQSDHLANLSILSVPEDRKEELAQLLRLFSGNTEFDFVKALRSLPWQLIQETDPAVLQQWREVLEAAKAEVEIVIASSKTRIKKPRFLLYDSSAPLPRFFPESLNDGIRKTARSIQDLSVRLKWVEMVLIAFHLFESFYKHNAANRVVFADFPFRIEQGLREAVDDFESGEDEQLVSRIEKRKEALEAMVAELAAVRQQVREQL